MGDEVSLTISVADKIRSFIMLGHLELAISSADPGRGCFVIIASYCIVYQIMTDVLVGSVL